MLLPGIALFVIMLVVPILTAIHLQRVRRRT